jgi:hypothetical protein
MKNEKCGPYYSVEELFNDIEKRDKEERKKNPIKWYAQRLWWQIEKIVEIPGDVFKEIKWFIQRGIRGWSDRDVWSIDYFIADIMPGMLKRLKETKHGIPSDLYCEAVKEVTGKDDYYYDGDDELDKKICDLGDKKQNEIIDNMIWTFEMAKKIQDGDVMLYNEKYNKILKEDIILTKEESDRFYSGFDLFKKHFFDLWD